MGISSVACAVRLPCRDHFAIVRESWAMVCCWNWNCFWGFDHWAFFPFHNKIALRLAALDCGASAEYHGGSVFDLKQVFFRIAYASALAKWFSSISPNPRLRGRYSFWATFDRLVSCVLCGLRLQLGFRSCFLHHKALAVVCFASYDKPDNPNLPSLCHSAFSNQAILLGIGMPVGIVWLDRDVDGRIAASFLDASALVFRLAEALSV